MTFYDSLYREVCSIGLGCNSTVFSKSSDTFAAISSSLLDVIGSEPFWFKAVAVSCSSVSSSSREMNNEAHNNQGTGGLQYIDR